MKIIRQTAVELVCQEKLPQFVKVILWVWIGGVSAAFLPLLVVFIRSGEWTLSFVLMMLLLSLIYAAIAPTLSETLTFDKTTDQLIYEKQTLVWYRRYSS